MTGWTALALAMAVVGAVAGVPGLILLGAATFAYGATTRLWSRYGLAHVSYERRLGSTGSRCSWWERALSARGSSGPRPSWESTRASRGS